MKGILNKVRVARIGEFAIKTAIENKVLAYDLYVSDINQSGIKTKKSSVHNFVHVMNTRYGRSDRT